MADEAVGPPVAGLLPPVGRRMRFGPFPSARDAIKFVVYAALGALVIPLLGTIAWLPLLGIAFLLSAWTPGGVPLDRTIVRLVARWFRALEPAEALMGRRARSVTDGRVRIDPGRTATVLRCSGHPLAFLPPEELQRRFGLYRDLLRSVEGGLAISAVGGPIDPAPFRPTTSPVASDEREASRAYAEMIGQLCRQRSRRRIYLLQWTRDASLDSRDDLERRTRELSQRLATLGLAPERLRGSALAASMRRFGWNEGEGGGPG